MIEIRKGLGGFNVMSKRGKDGRRFVQFVETRDDIEEAKQKVTEAFNEYNR